MPRILLAATLALAACTVPATNPFDPKSPLSEQAKASVTGTIVLLDDGASVAGVTVGLLGVDRQPVRGADGQVLRASVEGTNSSRGTFTLAGILPGQYTVSFGVDPRFRAPFVPKFTLAAGEVLSLGELDFAVQEAGTGSIRGRAALIDAAGGARTIGVFRRRDGRPPELVRQLTTDANGTFEANALPPGTYAVSAEATGFFPDFSTGHVLLGETSGALSSNEIVLEGENELRLYPATAVLVPDLPRKGATYFTNGDALDLLVIPTVVDAWVTDMRLSSDRAFHAGSEEMAFDAFRQRASVNLPEEEGMVPIYGQFRAKAGDFDFTTDVFETQVVRDVTPPQFVAAGLRGVNVTNGIAWLREDGATVTVEIQANDVASAVSAYGVYSDPANDPGVPDAVTFRDVSVPPGFVRIDHTTQLLPGQGPRVLGLWLRDNAGNVSGPERLEVIVDSEPPALVGPLKVVNADQQGQLDGRVAILKVPVEEACLDNDAVAGQCAVEFRYGTAPLPGSGFFSPFELGEDGTVVVQVTGGNGQSVGFEVQLRDAAGNVANYTSELYTLRLLGQLSGRALVDGYPDDSPAHGGALVELFEPGSDRSAPVATGTTSADGRFVLRTTDDGSARLPAGHYIVVVSRGDLEPFETETAVRENEISVLPAYRLTPARGFLRGRFARADQAGSNRAHGNIEVTASRNGVVVGRTITTDDGSYSFPAPGLPVTVGVERYTLLASASGYAAVRVEGVEVFRAQTTVVEPNGDEPRAVELARLAGDFVFCESLTDECLPTPYANTESVRIELLEATGVSEIRFQARTPFNSDSDAPDWKPFDAETPYVVRIAEPSDPDGNVTVYVQTRVGQSAGPVLSASVLLDRKAPHLTSFDIEPGANALPGFTSKPTVRAVVVASSGEGDVAPLYMALVAFASAPPAAPPVGAVPCSFGVACTIPLPATLQEKAHDAYAFACDRAGNCSTTPFTARIVYDATPPRQTNGLAFEPSATWITKADGLWYSRAGRVDVGVDVGTAKTNAGGAVLSPGGAAVPDVVAYRFGLRMDVADGTWRTLSDTTLPNARVTAQALEITGEDGRYDIYAQFRDAAGNVTAVEANPYTFAITVDRLPPAVAFAVNGGAEWTNDPALRLDVNTASGDIGPARDVMLSLDGGLFETFDKRMLPLVGSSAVYNLPGTDGSYSLYARFTDAAGNVSDRVARIYLDRTAPRIVSLKCGTCREDASTGAVYTTNRQAVLDFVASDNSGTIASVSTKVGASPASSGGYTGTVTVTLADVDGPQAIKLTVTDPAGNVSEERTITVVLDRTPPSVVMSINEGSEYAKSASVVIGITNNDGSALSGLRVSNTATFSGPVQAFTSQVPWSLSNPNEDGPRTVFIEVTDPAGNVTTASDGIILDSHAPAAPTLAITVPTPVGGSNAITSANVTLRILTSDGTRALAGAAVVLEGDVALSGGSTGWLTVGAGGLTSVTGGFQWTGALSAGDGPKQVSVRVRDAAGNVSDASIVRALLRTAAPSGGTASLAQAPVTASTAGTVSMSAQSASEFRLAGDLATVDGLSSRVGAWLPFTTSVPVVFESADGVKTVTVTFRNEAQQESESIELTTTLDRTPPSVPRFSSLLPEAQASPTLVVRLETESTDALSGLLRYEWLNPTLSGWTPVTFPTSYAHLSGNKSHTFRVRGVDYAGNVSAEDVVAVIHDDKVPLPPTVITPSTYVAGLTTSVTLAGGELDENFRYYETCTVVRAALEACPSWGSCDFGRSPSSFALSLTANKNTCLGARSVDAAGNKSEGVWTRILSDMQRPVPPVIGPAVTRESLVVRAQEVEVSVQAPAYDPPVGVSGETTPWENVAYLEVGVGGSFSALCPTARKGGKWSPCDPDAIGGRCTDPQLRCRGTEISGVVMPLAAGTTNTLSARAVDLAGNIGDAVSIEVLTAGAKQFTSLPRQASSSVLFGNTLGFTSAASGAGGMLAELGSNRTLDPSDPQCVINANSTSTIAIGRPGAAFVSGGQLRLRRRGADGAFCTADDSTLALTSISGTPKGLALGGETVGWVNDVWAVTCGSVQLREPGSDGLLNGVGDTTLTLPITMPSGSFDDKVLQIAEDALILRRGGCPTDGNFINGGDWVLIHRRKHASGYWTYSGGVQWPFFGYNPVLSPDGSFLATGSGRDVTVRERGPDGVFGTSDDRITTRSFPANFSVRYMSTDGLRIVGRVEANSTEYLFTWSPGLDAVFQTAADPLSDDAFSFFAPASSERRYVTVSNGLVVYSEYGNLKALDLAQARWETAARGSVRAPTITNGGLSYVYDHNPTVKLGTDETPADLGADRYLSADFGFFASGDDAAYAIYNTQSYSYEVHMRRRAPGGRAFGDADSVGLFEPAPPGETTHIAGVGGGKAILFPGPAHESKPVIVEPGTLGLANGSLVSAPSGTDTVYYGTQAGVSRNAAVWLGRFGEVFVWQAGVDGKFGTADDVPTVSLKAAPANVSEYRAGSIAHADSRIAMGNTNWSSISVVDAGIDKLFNTTDDTTLTVPAERGEFGVRFLSIAGDYMAWVGLDPATGTDQVYLYDFLTNSVTQITNHQSQKTDLHLTAKGRLLWVDSVFPYRSVFSFVP